MTDLARLGGLLSLGLLACSSGAQVSGPGASAQGSTAQGSTAQGSTAQGSTAQGSTAQGSTAQGSAEPALGRMDGPFYVEPDAPNPRACAADADCVGDTVTDSAGCCVASSTPVPQSWAYHTWLSTHRGAAACATASCRVFSPSPPLECEMTVRCVEGACANTCP